MKVKATKFKNPFDLMEQQEQEMMDTKPNANQAAYIPKGKVHIPLPFDPYQNAVSTKNGSRQSNPPKSSTSYQSILKQTKSSSTKNRSGFVNPFSSSLQSQQQLPLADASQTTPPIIGFNPLNTPQYRNSQPQSTEYSGELNQDGDPPLLQARYSSCYTDIGIDISLIRERMLMTVKAQTPHYQQLQNTDLSGPIFIALIFGCLLLLSGKVHFGDIYAMFLFGNTIMYFLINFMNQADVIPLYNVMSTLGYALLPILLLGFFGIFVSLKGAVGILLSLAIAFWASLAAGNTLEVYLREPHNNRKYLVVYPLFLFYLCFGMIVIF